MKIIIEPATNKKDGVAMLRIRQQVFEREMGIAHMLLRIPDDTSVFHLLARVKPSGDPVAALSVVDTSGNHSLHERYGLSFDPHLRVARYTQLAVFRPYRGMNIPLMMMLEAHRRFVAPNRFDYTWLLFDAERAASSCMCRLLAFTPSAHVFMSEYGRSRALVRDERAPHAKQTIRQAEQYLARFLKAFRPTEPRSVPQAVSV